MKNRFEIRGNQVAIFLDRIDGSFVETIISLQDLDKAKSIKGTWYARDSEEDGKYLYVVCNTPAKNGKRGTARLHRAIMDCPKGLYVDHIDHDTLNNTRENLRNVTQAENLQNIPMRQSNKSGYRGVSFDSGCGKWRVSLRIHGIKKYYGMFSDLTEAGKRANQIRKDALFFI